MKTQIGKMALVFMVIFSLASCTKEETNPYPTPQSGSYNIIENESSRIANLMTEAQIVDQLSSAAPVDGVYKTGRIIAINANAKLEMQYQIDSTELVKLSVPLTNENGNLKLTAKGTLTKSDGTILLEPSVPTSRKCPGHVTLLK
ncbi:MAG TPA: hypothetical protein PK431_14280 [Chitinophagales bacterium]|nr:hypothetical protein [Chitinophagales bacterium]